MVAYSSDASRRPGYTNGKLGSLANNTPEFKIGSILRKPDRGYFVNKGFMSPFSSMDEQELTMISSVQAVSQALLSSLTTDPQPVVRINVFLSSVSDSGCS